MDTLFEIKKIHDSKIKERILEFKNNSRHKELIRRELIYCLCTPQSKAKRCWEAVQEISSLPYYPEPVIAKILKDKGVRFHNKKAKYINDNSLDTLVDLIDAILKSLPNNEANEKKIRHYLKNHIKGMGFKEASHFLRNVGFGDHLSILDRHILKNLENFNVITEKDSNYELIEEKMKLFSESLGISILEVYWN
jgi:N-glycosylase/DNA lyase